MAKICYIYGYLAALLLNIFAAILKGQGNPSWDVFLLAGVTLGFTAGIVHGIDSQGDE